MTVLGRPLKPSWQGKHFQLSVCPTDGGGRRLVHVHVLVLITFVGPRPPGMWGLHRDDDPHNNHVSNLYWGTPSQNVLDSVSNGGHHNAGKKKCDRGHPLEGANLAPWSKTRTCLACNRATGIIRYYEHTTGDKTRDEAIVQSVADMKFAEIMGATA